MKLCMGCMNLIDDRETVCPICHYQERTKTEYVNIHHHLEEGTMLHNRYMIGRVLGFGGFGITYLAWDQKLQIPVAVKEYFPLGCAVRKNQSDTVTVYSFDMAEEYEAGLNRFLTEAQNLAKFHQTDGVVHIFDCLKENHTGYIIMEYLPGETLEKYLQNRGGRLPFQEAVDIILPVLNVLSVLHRENVIHRDISPDNIFMVNDGKIKLIDFGTSKISFSFQTGKSSTILKHGYSPLEQYMGNEKQGPWTDVYSTGAVLYRMVTGQKPPEAVQRIVNDRLIPPSEAGADIPDYADAVIIKSLALHARDRYQSAEEFSDHLKKKEVISPAQPPKKKKRIRKFVLSAAALALLLGLGTGIWFLSSGKQISSSDRSSGTDPMQAESEPAVEPETDQKAVAGEKVTVSVAVQKQEITTQQTTENQSGSEEPDDQSIRNQADTIEIPLSGGQNQQLTVCNHTNLTWEGVRIVESDTQETVGEYHASSLENEEPVSLQKDRYDLILYGKEGNHAATDQRLEERWIINADLRMVSEIDLSENDGYTYIENTSDFQDRKAGMDYQLLVYPDELRMYCKTDALNIRELPDTAEGEVLGLAKKGEEMTVCGQVKKENSDAETDWYLVKTSHGYGFVSANQNYVSEWQEIEAVSTGSDGYVTDYAEADSGQDSSVYTDGTSAYTDGASTYIDDYSTYIDDYSTYTDDASVYTDNTYENSDWTGESDSESTGASEGRFTLAWDNTYNTGDSSE